MMTETQQSISNLPTDAFPEKAAPIMNSQGEVIQAPSLPLEQPQQQAWSSFDDVIELGDTALAPAADALLPATDDGDMEHKIISCGHVLKSTHDLARWSEKTGARRVNTQESIDSVSDLAINLEPNRTGRRRFNNNASNNNASDPAADIQGLFEETRRGGRRNNRGSWQQQQQPQQKWQPVEGSTEKSEVINCWPVLKSTHDQAQLSEKRGKNAVNKPECSKALDELALNQNQAQQSQEPSQILNSWPVLKSTHDQAMFSEKHGANAVNQGAECTEALDEVIKNQGTQAGGSSLQSGLDTQAGSHIQMDNQQ